MFQIQMFKTAATRQVVIDARKDLAHLAYTGGTTGVPKAVMLTYFNVVANALKTACWFHGTGIAVKGGQIQMTYPEGIDPQRDRISMRDSTVQLTVNPWYHAMGIGTRRSCSAQCSAKRIPKAVKLRLLSLN